MPACRVCVVLLPADSWQEEQSHRQSQQEAESRDQYSGQEARDCIQSRRKPNMMDSLDRK